MNYLDIFVFIHVCIKLCFCNVNRCLNKDYAVDSKGNSPSYWQRKFHMANHTLPIVIDYSERPSHKIMSFIIQILISERLRYKDVDREFLSQFNNTFQVMSRFNTESRPKNQGKLIKNPRINIEVWQPPGFNVEAMVNRGLVLDCGPLGPIARKGIFAFTSSVHSFYSFYNVSIDHWKFFQQPYDFWDYKKVYQFLTENNQWKSVTKIELNRNALAPIILIDKLEYKDELESIFKRLYSKTLKVILMVPTKTDDAAILEKTLDKWELYLSTSISYDSIGPLFFYNWYPNTVTVRRSYSRVLFPDWYNDNSDELLTQFQINQMSKMASVSLKQNAPLIYNLISDFRISHQHLVEILRQVGKDQTDQHLYSIACNWVNTYGSIWKKWTVGWNEKHKLIIPAFIALYGKWVPEYVAEASTIMIKKMNAKLFKRLEYELVLDVRNLSCKEELVLREYISYSSKKLFSDSGTIIGYLAAICSDSLESSLKLATFNKHIMVTPTADSPKFNDKNQYKYFFRNIPSMDMQMKMLTRIFKEWNWKRLVLLRKDSMFFEPKFFNLQNITVIEDFIVKEEELKFNKILTFLRRIRDVKKGRIFIVEYFKKATLDIMCAAYKLNMSLENGFVWFLNPWMNYYWNNESTSNCTKLQIRQITSRYFILTHNWLNFSSTPRFEKDPIDDVNKYTHFPYARFSQEVIKSLGHAIITLLQKYPSEISVLHSATTAKRFIQLISKNYKFQENWRLQAHIDGNIIPIFIWRPNDHYGRARTPTKYSNKNYQDYDMIFIHYGLLSKKKLWGLKNNNAPPLDGTEPADTDPDCIVERLRKILGLSCSWTIFLCCSTVTTLIILFGICCFIMMAVKLRKNQEDDRARKPYEFLCEDLANYDLPGDDVVINRVVGKGNFGTVFGGEARVNGKWVLAAVKAISKMCDYQFKYDFLTEAKLLSSLDHKNIVKLIGICLNPKNNISIYLIMEHITGRDLKQFLVKRRVKAKEDPDNEKINALALTHYAKDIASGLNYLHQNFYLHRDIACRNCLIEPDFGIKLGDFGLAKKMKCDRKGNSWYYRFAGLGAMPIRWLPPECLQYGNYSIHSDIWSYGVTLYEILTFGSFPFGGIEHEEVIDKVKRGRFSVANFLPQYFRDELVYNMIKKCCSYSACDRYQSMSDIIEIFEKNPECVKACLTPLDDKPNENFANSLYESGNPCKLPHQAFKVPTSSASVDQCVSNKRISQISSPIIPFSSSFSTISQQQQQQHNLNHRDRLSHPPMNSGDCMVAGVSDAPISSSSTPANYTCQPSTSTNYSKLMPQRNIKDSKQNPNQYELDHTKFDHDNDMFLRSFVGIENKQPNMVTKPPSDQLHQHDQSTDDVIIKNYKLIKSPSIEFIPLQNISNSISQNNFPNTPDCDLGYVTYKTEQSAGTPVHNNGTLPPLTPITSVSNGRETNANVVTSKPILTSQQYSLDLSIDTCSDIVELNKTTKIPDITVGVNSSSKSPYSTPNTPRNNTVSTTTIPHSNNASNICATSGSTMLTPLIPMDINDNLSRISGNYSDRTNDNS